MSTLTKNELITRLEAALKSGDYRKRLEAESIATLTKLNALPAATIRQLLDKAASKKKSAFSSLKTGPQPETFDAAATSGVNVLLWGAPGRGKSILADAIAKRHAARTGGIVSQIVCPEDTQVSVLAGSFQPAEGGAWKWVDGPVTRALRNGGSCILDELAHLSPEGATWLLSAMDSTPSITLPSGEAVEKQPVWFVSTQNDTPASLLPPLGDRHPVRMRIDLPYAWDWLGCFAPLAERDLATQESASLRPWAALRRMTDAGVPYEQSVSLLWPDSPSQLSAIKLALDEAK